MLGAFYTFSTDGGQTWAPDNLRVSDRSMNRDEGFTMNPKYDARAPMGLASSSTAAHVTWPDSGAGRPNVPVGDVYLAAVLHGPPVVEDDDGIDARSVVFGAAIGVAAAGLVVFVLSMTARRRRPQLQQAYPASNQPATSAMTWVVPAALKSDTRPPAPSLAMTRLGTIWPAT